jgi:hypothetical protein
VQALILDQYLPGLIYFGPEGDVASRTITEPAHPIDEPLAVSVVIPKK